MKSIALAQGSAFTLLESAQRTKTTGTNGDAVLSGFWRRIILLLDITASQTDAGDTLDVYVDVSPDGTTWFNAVHFNQQAGNGSAVKRFAVLDPSNPGTSTIDVTTDASSGAVRPALFGAFIRARYVLVNTGTENAAHTFSVTGYGQ